MDKMLKDTQCGFHSGRSMIDMIFTARQLVEKSIEQQSPLCVAFIDITKAFDSVDRNTLINILETMKCPPNLLEIIKSFHTDTKTIVQVENCKIPAFSVKTGVRQGCVMAPLLFIIYMQIIINNITNKNIGGIDLNFRNDSNMFNRRNLKATTKIKQLHLLDLMFADDCALFAETPELLQELTNAFVEEAKKLGLQVNESKTEVMFVNTPAADIYINNTKLQTTQSFKYLGTHIQTNGRVDDDINQRINKASMAFQSLYQRLWKPHEITLRTKLMVYEAVVLSTLLYSAECWTALSKHVKTLNAFHLRCLKTICKIKWTDKIPNDSNEEVLERTNTFSIDNILKNKRLKWAGHISRMDENRAPHQIAFSELKKGERPQTKPKKRWIDILKEDLKELNINIANWREVAANRSEWRQQLYDRIKNNQERKISSAKTAREEKHTARELYNWKCPLCNHFIKQGERGRQEVYSHIKENHQTQNRNDPPPYPDDLKCTICNMVCKSKSGYSSHVKSKHIHANTTAIKPIRLVGTQGTPTPGDSNDQRSQTHPPTVSQPTDQQNTALICIACSKSCRSLAGLKSYQRNAICRQRLDTMVASDTMDT
ncbi:hypothetical protein M8J77_003494 [Diaphorina citri]|nr:hypothetical protein M8J77_003494 [Diaphorina citri]